jgi:hypothetical protein
MSDRFQVNMALETKKGCGDDHTPTVNTVGIHVTPCMRAAADFAKSAIWRRGWA